jgi:hypothetical protein
MKPKGLLTNVFTTVHHSSLSWANWSNLQANFIYDHFNITLPPTPRPAKRSFFLFNFPTYAMYAFLFCPTHLTSSALLHFVQSTHLSPRKPGFNSRSVYVGFVMGKWRWGFSSEYFAFPVSNIPQIFHTYSNYLSSMLYNLRNWQRR